MYQYTFDSGANSIMYADHRNILQEVEFSQHKSTVRYKAHYQRYRAVGWVSCKGKLKCKSKNPFLIFAWILNDLGYGIYYDDGIISRLKDARKISYGPVILESKRKKAIKAVKKWD